MPGYSNKSELLTARISKTQHFLLRKMRATNKLSPLIRVLLSLYLNGRLAAFNIEAAIAEEVARSTPPSKLDPKA